MEDYEKYIDELKLHGTRELAEEICTLEQQCKKQKEVIDKAIERIKKGIFIIPKDTDELLNILKEVSE